MELYLSTIQNSLLFRNFTNPEIHEMLIKMREEGLISFKKNVIEIISLKQLEDALF